MIFANIIIEKIHIWLCFIYMTKQSFGKIYRKIIIKYILPELYVWYRTRGLVSLFWMTGLAFINYKAYLYGLKYPAV